MAKKTKRPKIKRNKFSHKLGILPHKKKTLYIMVILLALFLLLVFLVLRSYGIIEPVKEERYFEVRDQCQVVRGNLIHPIRNAGECRIGCTNECYVREMEFVRSSFEFVPDDCHKCDCYCK